MSLFDKWWPDFEIKCNPKLALMHAARSLARVAFNEGFRQGKNNSDENNNPIQPTGKRG